MHYLTGHEVTELRRMTIVLCMYYAVSSRLTPTQLKDPLSRHHRTVREP